MGMAMFSRHIRACTRVLLIRCEGREYFDGNADRTWDMEQEEPAIFPEIGRNAVSGSRAPLSRRMTPVRSQGHDARWAMAMEIWQHPNKAPRPPISRKQWTPKPGPVKNSEEQLGLALWRSKPHVGQTGKSVVAKERQRWRSRRGTSSRAPPQAFLLQGRLLALGNAG